MTWLYLPSTVSPSAQAEGGLSSGSGSPSALATDVWVTSSGTPSLRPPSWRGWRTRPWVQLLSGTTWPPSTADRGAERWTSSLLASRASHSPQPDAVPATATSGSSGLRSSGWFAKWDPISCSWRTATPSLPLASPESTPSCSVTWPGSGSMRNGACYQRRTLGPLIAVGAGGAWPTATAADSRSSGGNPETTGTHGVTLTDAARRTWATPAAEGGPEPGRTSTPNRTGDKLVTQVIMWTTPVASENANRDTRQYRDHPRRSTNLAAVAGSHCSPQDGLTATDGDASSPPTRHLNPRFVEWLMGWPIGWTDCESSATESYRSWLRRHSRALSSALGRS